tara:strand:- start:114 stop:596 length:483 start_codon:yes stop_codon:yes gene_type:complete
MVAIKNKRTLKIILILSVLTLSAAYFIEFVLGYEPCRLCLFQRIPYMFAIILIALLFILNKYEKIITIIIGLFFVFGTIVSIYHVGIEQGIFEESFVCELFNTKNSLSSDELLKQLEKNIVSCKEISFTILGFSLATFNTLISLILSGILFKNIWNYEKN